MRYHLKERGNLTRADIKQILEYEVADINKVNRLGNYFNIQRKLNAERRMMNEKNEQRKQEMQELYNSGEYDFDFYFGEDPQFMT